MERAKRAAFASVVSKLRIQKQQSNKKLKFKLASVIDKILNDGDDGEDASAADELE